MTDVSSERPGGRQSPLGGRVLAGRYRLESRLQTGLRSGIFMATDVQLEQQVAVRVVDAETAAEPGFVERFRSAANVAAGIEHPNLVRVLDWGIEELDGEARPYLVLEHLAGGTLREMLDRGRLLTPSQALVVGLDVCRALDVIHRRQLLHGEVRPKHLIFGADRRVRLGDVVLSSVLADRAWRDPEKVDLERARYAAPEQAQGRPFGAPADIYGLCLSLIEAVTGELPFSADSTVLALANRVDRLMPVSADLGPLASVLERAGRPDPAERSSAAEFGAALIQVAQRLPRPAPIPLVGAGLSVESRAPEATGWPGPDVTGDAPRPVTPPPVISPPVTPPPLFDGAASLDPPTAPQPLAAVPAVGRRRMRRGLWWIVATAAILAAGGLGVLAYRVLSTTTHPVPALVGRDIAEVGNLIAEFEWELVVQRERSDEQPLDAVVRTEPPEGEQLAEGGSLVVVVSLGPTLSPLPELEGLPVELAEQRLTEAGFRMVVSGLRFDEVVPEGSVISWTVPDDPALTAGAEVVKGTEVSVLVSQGAEPRTVPELVGRDPAEVVAELKAMGLVAVEFPADFSDDIPAGLIVNQFPSPGERVERGAEVRYALSKGPDVVPVPPLAGLDHAGVVQALEQADLTVGEVVGDTSLALLGVSVDGRPVRAGELLKRGTAVDLVYAFAP